MTRDSDLSGGDTPSDAGTPAAALALDDRAGIANHARGAACLLLHATGSGVGVHLYSSELTPAPVETELLPWLTAQAAWVPQSEQLEKALATALNRARIPLVVSAASVRPVDSLTCPALVWVLGARCAERAPPPAPGR
jgi:N-acetylmuramoyl-L-alanine amidase